MATGTLFVTWLDGTEDEFEYYEFPCVPRTGDFLQVMAPDNFGAVVTMVELWIYSSDSGQLPSFTVKAHEVCDACGKPYCNNPAHGAVATKGG